MRVGPTFSKVVLIFLLLYCEIYGHGRESKFFDAKKIVKNKFRKLFGMDDPGERCKKKKARNERISAHTGISPTKVFGYLEYDDKINMSKVSPGMSLSYLNGYRQHMKVGVRDFLVQGKVHEVSAFLDCFSEYQVIGSFLDEDGHWKNKPCDKYPLFMQVQNLDKYVKNMHVGVAEIILRRILHDLISYIKRGDVIFTHLDALVGVDLKDFIEPLMIAIREYPELKSTLEGVRKIITDSSKNGEQRRSKKELAMKIYRYLSGADEYDLKQEKWSDFESIDLQQPVVLKFTMYPSPSHYIRATYKFESSTVSVADAARSFQILMAKSPISRIFDKLISTSDSSSYYN